MAALAGQGLALGRLALIEPLVTEKRLAVLKAAGAEYANDYAYWLIEAERKPRADAARVSEWIKAEAAAVDMALADIC